MFKESDVQSQAVVSNLDKRISKQLTKRLDKLESSGDPIAKAESHGFFMTSAEAEETPRVQLKNQVILEPLPMVPTQSQSNSNNTQS